MRKIYKRVGTESIVVNNSNLVCSTDRGLKSISHYLPSFEGNENLTVIPIESERMFLPYFKDYVIDWLRMPDEVNAILDIKKKALSERYQKMVAAGYTRTEMIYLDSEQATTFASSLQNFAAISTEAIMAFCDYGVSKVSGRWDALLAQAQAMPNVSRLLSEAEVIDALAQVGATKDTVETSIITELKDMRNKAVKIKEEFDGLSSKLLNGIQELVKKDEGLAREYKRWGNI